MKAGGGFTILAGAALLGACATPAATDPVTLRFHTPSEITVASGGVGRFEAVAGCVLFRYADNRVRRAALFPPGSRLSESRRSILLPNRQAIPFGERVSIAFEAPPFKPHIDRSCGPDPIQVLELARPD